MRIENSAFIGFDNDTAGVIYDDSNHSKYPIIYYNVINGIGFEAKPDRSYYGYVYGGKTILYSPNRPAIELQEGMFFSLSGTFSLSNLPSSTTYGKVILIEVHHTRGIYPETKYSAVFHVGGPIEPEGRLKYIDGCTDSLLIPPVKLGDPCFNHLHFPTQIVQTPHTHPSHRIGIVAKGNGLCVTPYGNLALVAGMIFVIKEWDGHSKAVGIDGNEYEIGNHCFHTFDESMDVIAFHPDSDFGPQDENHPMLNRTIVNGISAKNISEIRTK